MGMLSGLKRLFGFSPARWVGTEQIKTQTRGLKAILVELVTPAKSARTESFEEAMTRLNLSEEDLQKREKEFSFLSRFFAFLGLMLVLYFIYLLFRHAWWPAAGSCGVLLVIFSQWLRYNFWLFQIRQRKLGCTFREWLASFGGKHD